MILADLPYGTTACSWDSVLPVEHLWEQWLRLSTSNGSVVLTANQPFTSKLVSSRYDLFKYQWVWVKNRPTGQQHAKNRPMGKHEDVLVFSPGKMGHAIQVGDKRMIYNPIGVSDGPVKTITTKGSHSRLMTSNANQVGREYVSQTGFPHTILEFPKDESHIHPTQKPVALFEYLIRTYTNPGDTVLDNTAGSGTTAIAAERCGRKWICIERDPEYAALAIERIVRHVHA
jgi:site-specific DNA-methyltransferase (adenine-specific)